MTAGQNNDVSMLLNLMVVNNRSMEDILFVAHSNETILNTICCKGLFKTFEFIMNKAEKALFIDRMNMAHQYNETCLDITIWGNQTKILKRLFEFYPELMADGVKDDNKLFRWVYWLVTKPGGHVFMERDIKMWNYLLNELKLNDKQWQMLLRHRAPREKEGDFANEASHIKYHVAQLFVLAVKDQKTPVILQLFEKRMSEKVFVEGLFVPDMHNTNACEGAVRGSKIEIVKYLLGKKDVVRRIQQDKDTLHRLLCIAYRFADDVTLNYLKHSLKVDVATFVDYKYESPVKKGMYFTPKCDEWYKTSLLNEAVSSGNAARVKTLLDLCKTKKGNQFIERKGRQGR
eukprot:351885_1